MTQQNRHPTAALRLPVIGTGRPDWDNTKYNPQAKNTLQQVVEPAAALNLPPSIGAEVTREGFSRLINASIAHSSWTKYQSGLQAFYAFEKFHDTTFSWPLSTECWRAFVVWCVTSRKLKPTSARSYMSALKFVHHLKNIPCLDTNTDPVISMLLRGASNLQFNSPPQPSTRRVVTLPLLSLLGHKIAGTTWAPLSKQVVWSVCTVAFFSSARMG